MNRSLVPLGIFLLLFALLGLGIYRVSEDPGFSRNVPSALIGKQAPEIVLPDLFNLSGKVSSADLKGKVWLLNVWGTWCPECWREHKFLMHLAKNEGVLILGIDWRDEAPEARQMLAQEGNPFVAVGFDPDSSSIMDWGVYGAPETFLIDKQGVIRWKHAGGLDHQLWQDELKPLMAELEQAP